MSVDSPSRKPDDLVATIRDLDRRLRALETANRLTSASVGSGGLRILDGGSLTVSGPATIGGTTTLNGDLRVPTGGDVTVEGGDLVLETRPAQLKRVEANRPAIWSDSVSGFTVDTTERELSDTLSVPSWAVNAFALIGGSVTARNGSGSAGRLWVNIGWTAVGSDRVAQTPTHQSSTGNTDYTSIGINDPISINVTNDTSLTIRVKWRSASGSWGSDSQNWALIRGLVIWNGYGVDL